MTETDNSQPVTKGDIAGLRTELKADIKQLDQRVGGLEQKVSQLDKTVFSLAIEVSKTNLRMDTLENNIMTALRSFKSELLSAFEASVMKGQMYTQKAVTHGSIRNAQAGWKG